MLGNRLLKTVSLSLVLLIGLMPLALNHTSWLATLDLGASSGLAGTAFASSSAQVGANNVTVASLQFEQNVMDSSSSHNSGTVTGTAQYVKGRVGSFAFSFNGASHISLANPSQFAFDRSNPFTISFWLKMPPNNSQDMYLVSNSMDQNSAGISIWRSHLSNSVTFKIQNTWAKAFQVSGNLSVSDNRWHLLLFSYDGSSNQKGMKIYVDGALQAVGTAATISGTTVTSNSETVGSTVSGALPFTGVLDDFKVLNYVMSPSSLVKFFHPSHLFKPTLYVPLTTSSGVSLSWMPVIGAVGYNVYRNGALVTSLEPSPSYFDSGLSPSTTYSYTVRAVNSSGSVSAASSPMSATTTSLASTTPLRALIFSPNISSATMSVLASNYKAGDGVIADRVPYIEQIQNTLKIKGLRHFVTATHITPLDPTCNLGPATSFADNVAQSKQAKLSGYNIEAIVYDIEGWCWTPQTEQNNYTSYIDQAAQLAHQGGFKSAVEPTHSELLQWYTTIHWKNLDYLFIQFHKQVMSKNSNYTLEDPQYFQEVSTVISYVKSQNPKITIFINYSPNWAPTGSMIDGVDSFKNQIQGVIMYDLPPYDSNNVGSPYPGYNTPSHQDQFLKAVKSIK